MDDLRADDLRLLSANCSMSKSRATRAAAERVDAALQSSAELPAGEAMQLHVDDMLALTGTSQYSLKASVREAAARVAAVVAAVKERAAVNPEAPTTARMRH
jgi:hypothetical protein